MNRLSVQANKEWAQFRRDRLSLALAFLLPVFSLLLFGYGIRLESKNVSLMVRDLDNSPITREYVDRLYVTNMFSPARPGQGKKSDISTALDEGKARVGITIPEDFTRKLYRREKPKIDVQVDGTDLPNAQIVSNTITAANLHFLDTLEPEGTQKAEVDSEMRLWFNPGRKENLFIVPGVFGIILWMYPSLLAAVASSREKEYGTIERVYASPASAFDLLSGKALVYFIVGMSQAILMFFLGWLLFGVTIKTDPIPLLLATPIYVFTAVMFGLFLGTFTSSQTTAVQAASSAGFFPCLLLSGFVYPIANIPFPLSLLSLAVPARYYIELTRDAFVRGIGWTEIWNAPLALTFFALALYTFSWLGSRRMQLRD